MKNIIYYSLIVICFNYYRYYSTNSKLNQDQENIIDF